MSQMIGVFSLGEEFHDGVKKMQRKILYQCFLDAVQQIKNGKAGDIN